MKLLVRSALLVAVGLAPAVVLAGSAAYRVKDINPGPGGSQPGWLTELNGTLFFAASDGELWKTDGTEIGTVQVTEIAPGGLRSEPEQLTVLNGVVYFSADDNTHGREVWRSDGTAPGTFMLADVNPSGSGNPLWFKVWNGSLYFGANNGVHGRELWKSDGTPGGTAMLKDIQLNAGSSDPFPLGDANGVLFLAADDGANGRELWKTDGTVGGTVLVRNIAPGALSSDPTLLFDLGNGVALFFTDELWRTDGTFFGTSLVANLNPTGGCAAQEGVVFQGKLYFTATGGPSIGFELWRSDGTGPGTAAMELNPGGASAIPHSLTVVGDRLYFVATSPEHESSLFVSEGTLETAYELYDSFLGNGPSVGSGGMAHVRGRLFFPGFEGTDRELWWTNGRLFGTTRVHDIHPTDASGPVFLKASGGRVFFSANDGVSGQELWASDAIFDDDFETFFLAPPFEPWSANSNDCPASTCDLDLVFPGLEGAAGMLAVVNDTNPLYVVDETPTDEGEYHARFLFDPNGFDPGEAQGRHRARIFLGFSDQPQRRLITLVLTRNNGAYRIILRTRRDDGTTADLPGVAISDGPHAIEVAWKRATAPGASDGTATLWIDDVLAGTVTGVDNDNGAIDFVRMGAMGLKGGAAGVLLYDRFQSRRFRHIGP